MKLQLRMNELGLYQSLDRKFGIRQVAEGRWAIQHRSDAEDPWDWEIIDYKPNFKLAVAYLANILGRDEEAP